MRNDTEMYQRIADRNGWVAEAGDQLGVEPPRGGGGDPRAAAQFRAADSVRRQLITRVKQFNKQPAERRAKMFKTAEAQFAKAKRRIGDGFEVPSFKTLMEDPDAWSKLEPKRSTLSGQASLDEIIDEAYLRTLSRFPNPEETAIATNYVRQSENPTDGIEGLMWALVNTKEFIISH